MGRVKVKGIEQVLKDIQKKKSEIITERKATVIRDLVDKLKAATPVDTGRARDGWKVSGNSIENDVPYIEQLNEGSSQQAPVYFIETTLLKQPGIKPSGIIVKKK
jgi:hypothetical protein